MSISRQDSFEQSALASGLVGQQDIDEARATLRWTSPEEKRSAPSETGEPLADRLVEMGLLNAWQATQLLEGRTKFNLGPYWILDGLGQGGMGQVFRAEHEITGRVVAIKVLPRSRSTPEAIENFNREIRATARLNHDHLVRALDSGHDGNVYYLVTEYVPGLDLRKLVRRDGPLDMYRAASIVSQVAEALQHAHEQGIVHRDVKPGNVLVTAEGVAKLSDLGLAGPLEGAAENDPRFGKIVGTADYLSPDHIKSPWTPTPAWDIYSLGCTLYYAVTGKVPFPGGTTADKARAHCELTPLDPRRLNSQLTPAFVDVLADMMAKDPAQRIASATEVIRRLKPWTDSASAEAEPQGLHRKPPVRRQLAAAPAIETDEDEDTDASFPDMPLPQAAPSAPVVANVASPPTAPRPRVAADSNPPEPALSVAGPLLVLVVLPLALVAIVMLVTWLAEAVF